MSADSRNTVTLVGGIVDDPETIAGKVVKMRLAVDYAGQDADNKENRSGYFTIKHFLGQTSPNLKFVDDQVTTGKIKKGSQVVISGRLIHNRFSVEGNRRAEVEVHLESLNYVGSRPADGEGAAPAVANRRVEDLPADF